MRNQIHRNLQRVHSHWNKMERKTVIAVYTACLTNGMNCIHVVQCREVKNSSLLLDCDAVKWGSVKPATSALRAEGGSSLLRNINYQTARYQAQKIVNVTITAARSTNITIFLFVFRSKDRQRGIRSEMSSPAWTLGPCVRIPLEACVSVVCVYSVFVLSCVGSGLATGWSSVHGVLSTVC
jgi:hypothetical protein